MSGPHMGTVLLLILFSPSTSENSASLWDEGPDFGMPVQSMILLGQLSLGIGMRFPFPGTAPSSSSLGL